MKAPLTRHFETVDPVIASIVSISTVYNLHRRHGITTVFEALASSIASQQISGAVAAKILGRLVAAHGGRFPTPAQIAAAAPDALRAVGFSFAKVRALQDLAAHCLDGRLPADAELATMDDESLIECCSQVRGIGKWTAQMLLMFHFGRQDVLPADDFGVRNGFRLAYGLKRMPLPKALLAYGERWAPYRSAAAWYLWRAVELHSQGKLPKRTGRVPRLAQQKRKAGLKSKPVAKRVASKRRSRLKPGKAARPK